MNSTTPDKVMNKKFSYLKEYAQLELNSNLFWLVPLEFDVTKFQLRES